MRRMFSNFTFNCGQILVLYKQGVSMITAGDSVFNPKGAYEVHIYSANPATIYTAARFDFTEGKLYSVRWNTLQHALPVKCDIDWQVGDTLIPLYREAEGKEARVGYDEERKCFFISLTVAKANYPNVKPEDFYKGNIVVNKATVGFKTKDQYISLSAK